MLETGASVVDEGGAAVVLSDVVCCCCDDEDDDSVGADDVGMISDDEVVGDDDEVVVEVEMSDEVDIIDWSVVEVLSFAVVLVLTSSGTAEEEVESTC